MSRLGRMPVDTAWYIAAYLAGGAAKQSDKQSADETCAKSSICPEHDTLRSTWISKLCVSIEICLEVSCPGLERCLLILVDILHGLLLRTWSNNLTDNPPMRRALSLQSAPSMTPCATFASCVLFISAQASGLWKQ